MSDTKHGGSAGGDEFADLPETQFFQPGIDASGLDDVEEQYLSPGDAEFYDADFDPDDFDDADFGDADYGEEYGDELGDDVAGEEPADGEYTEEEWREIERSYGISLPNMVEEALPTVSIVGRPNVGKSTLVNRFLGRREAVVEDHPGVTRDRVSYLADWGGRRFWVQDTGGWDPDAKGIHAAIARQSEAAMETSDVIVMVVDSHTGITETDAVMARNLQRSEIPVILVANKFESESQWGDVAEFYSLGLGDPWPVSALHGRGGADVLDEILRLFPEVPRAANSVTDGPRRVALVGRPNVGKSSLLNKLSKSNRSVVDNVAGTTVDPVDELIQLDEHLWKFIDTAGLRKKVKNAQGHEYYASLRTRGTIDAAEVCVVVIDASEEISEQDQRVISMVLEAGKAMVIAFNKWDLMDEDRRYYFDREFDEMVGHLGWVTKINISADTGRGLHRLEPAMTEALENWDRRVSTGQLNNWLREAIAANPPPMKNNRLPKLLFATMAATRPPTIILFTTGFLDAGYRRYLERKFREQFGFHGTPIRIAVRVRERNPRRRR